MLVLQGVSVLPCSAMICVPKEFLFVATSPDTLWESHEADRYPMELAQGILFKYNYEFMNMLQTCLYSTQACRTWYDASNPVHCDAVTCRLKEFELCKPCQTNMEGHSAWTFFDILDSTVFFGRRHVSLSCLDFPGPCDLCLASWDRCRDGKELGSYIHNLCWI